jgi:hypothetical protein
VIIPIFIQLSNSERPGALRRSHEARRRDIRKRKDGTLREPRTTIAASDSIKRIRISFRQLYAHPTAVDSDGSPAPTASARVILAKTIKNDERFMMDFDMRRARIA